MFPRVPSTDAPDGVAVSVEAPSDRERQLLLWLLNLSHAVDHFQNQIVTAVYPVIAAEMGMGPTQLGVFTAIRNIFAGWTQLGYGFVTPFVQRPRLLGVGNLVVALGTFFTGLAGSFGTLLMARCFTATGSSAQHPVGASLLTSYFQRAEGRYSRSTTASQASAT